MIAELVDDIVASNLPSKHIFTTLFSFRAPNNLGRSSPEIGSSPVSTSASELRHPIFPVEEFIIRPDTAPSCISLFRRRFPRIVVND